MSQVSLLLDLVDIDVSNSVVAIEDLLDLLESRTLGLNVDKVDKDELEEDPDGVEEGEIPVARQVLPRDRVGLVSDGEDGRDGDVHDHQTLGTKAERQNFQCVGDEQTGPRDGVEDAEDPDDGDLNVTGGFVGVARVLVYGRCDGPDGEHDHHAGGTDEEEAATTGGIDESGGGDGGDEGNGGLTNVETQTLTGAGDSCALVDQAGVVGEQSVTGVLRNDTERDQNGQPPAVTSSLQEVDVAATLVGLFLHAHRLLDLLELELDGGVELVSSGVVVGEHVESLVSAIFADKPSRRLWDPVDEAKLNDGWEDLKKGDDLPGPVTLDVLAAVRDERRDYAMSVLEDQSGRWRCLTKCTKVPQGVVDGGETSSVLRVTDLSEEDRTTHLSHRVTETEDETTGEVGLPVLANGGDDTTDDHDDTTDGDGKSTSKPVCHVWNNEERADGTEVVSVVHKTETGTLWVVEELDPVSHVLGVVHHHSGDCQSVVTTLSRSSTYPS